MCIFTLLQFFVSSSVSPSLPLPQLLSYLSLCPSVSRSLSLCYQTEMFPSLSPFSGGHLFNNQSLWSNSHLMKQLETRSPTSLTLSVKSNTCASNSDYHSSLLVLNGCFSLHFNFFLLSTYHLGMLLATSNAQSD